jgi:hypothetical protein
MNKHLIKRSGNCYTETQIEKGFVNKELEYDCQSYAKYRATGAEKQDLEVLNVKKSGMGVRVTITKVGKKRNTELSISLGKDEVELLKEYFSSVEIENYNCDEIIKSKL